MRIDGILKSWNDDRGFGFIKPSLGGQEIFVHIKAFESRFGRPNIGQHLTFEIAMSLDGKRQAKRVQYVQIARSTSYKRNNSFAKWITAAYFTIPAIFLVVLMVYSLSLFQNWVVGLYFVVSIVCFIAYAIDKSAASAGRRRVPETMLLFMGLVGGWPGAILAQQLLRHKTKKLSFRIIFFGSVVLNILCFVVLSSPLFSLIHP